MPAVRHAFARLRALPQRTRDGLIAAAVLVGTVAQLLTSPNAPSIGHLWPSFGLLVVMAAFLTRRSRQPLATLCAIFATLLASNLFDHRILNDPSVPLAGLVLSSWAAGVQVDRRRLLRIVLPVTATGIALVAISGAGNSGQILGNFSFGELFLLLPLAGARAERAMSALADALGQRTRELEAERATGAREAVARERSRIARELQDVVAHGVSGMVVQAAAAQRLARSDEVTAAEDAIAAIEERGREALGEMRRLLGVLRRGDESLALAPHPSLARIDRLLAEHRAQGLPVDLDVQGQEIALPPGLDAAAYRVVEEAVRNVVRHAGHTPTHVTIRYERRTLDLAIVDDGAIEGAGSAVGTIDNEDDLVGMRERVALYGGSLQTGPRRTGGYAVRARLPLEAAT